MDAPDRRRILLAAFMLLLAGYLGVSRVYLPKRAALADLEVRLEALQRHNHAAQQIEASGAAGEVEGELRELQKALSAFALSLPTAEELPEVIEALSNEALRTGVELAQLNPTPPLTDRGLAVQRFDVIAEGNYVAIAEFLGGVVGLPWLVEATVGDLSAANDPSPASATDYGDPGDAARPARLQARIGLQVVLAPPGTPRNTGMWRRERQPVADERISMSDPFRSPVQNAGWGLRPENLSLLGVIRGGARGGPIAVVARADGARALRVRTGDQVGGLRVHRIDDDQILVSFDDLGVAQTVTLRLRRSGREEPA